MNKKPIALVVAGGLAVAGTAFTMNALASGYMQGTPPQDVQGTQDTQPAKAAEGGCGVDKMDTDKDGKVSKAEFATAHEGSDEKFAAHDPNRDGFIDAAEMEAHHKADGDKAKMEGKCGEGKCGEGKCGGSA